MYLLTFTDTLKRFFPAVISSFLLLTSFSISAHDNNHNVIIKDDENRLSANTSFNISSGDSSLLTEADSLISISVKSKSTEGIGFACSPPIGLNEDAGSYKAILQWVHSTTYQEYNIRWRAVGDTEWKMVNKVCCSSFTIYNLQKDRPYEWQIQRICTDGTYSDFTQPRQFTTKCTLGGINYAYSTTTHSALISWPISRFLTYNIAYRQVTTPQTSYSILSGIKIEPLLLSYTLTNLQGFKTYEVLVQAVCDQNDISPFTPAVTFTTSCHPPFTPETSPSLNQAIIKWNTTPLTTYSILYRPVGASSYSSVSNLTSSPFTLTGLSPNTVYQCMISSQCNDGSSSGFSDMVSFTTSCIAPRNGYQKNIASVEWQNLGSNLVYEIQYRQNGETTWAKSLTTTATDITLPGLNDYTQYEWQVRVKCNSQVWSDWSKVFTFMTYNCFAPYPLPEDFIEGGAVLLSWTSNTYDKCIFQWKEAGKSEWSSDTLSGNHYYLTGLQTGTTYEWRVRNMCSTGMFSEFSRTRTFTTSCDNNSLRSGISYVDYNTAEIYYYGTPGVSYQIHWRQSGDIRWNTSRYTLCNFKGPIFHKILGLVSDTNYEVRIKALCSDGSTSSLSSPLNFLTQCGFTNYLAELAKSSTSVTIKWGAPTRGIYTVRWAEFNKPFSGSVVVTKNTYTIKDLLPFQTYLVEIKYNCSNATWRPFYINTNTECAAFVPEQAVSSLTSNSLVMSLSDGSNGFNAIFSYNPANITEKQAVSYSVNTVTPVSISALTPGAMYLLQLKPDAYGCFDYIKPLFFLPPSLSRSATIYSVANGNWDNPDTWSARRVPDKTDTVGIRHTVTIPDNTTGTAEYILYYKAGRIIQKSGALLQTGY